MTRINVVPVAELCDQHLLAEHRELTRIPNGILSGKLKVHYDDRPQQYTLGKGHVKFFTDKLLFLFDRYKELTSECKKRGFNVQNIWPYEARHLVSSCMDESTGRDRYTPSELDFVINRRRINERWPKKARYCGMPYHYRD